VTDKMILCSKCERPVWQSLAAEHVCEPDETDEPEMCPQGCGRTTEDPYGGPCSKCWEKV